MTGRKEGRREERKERERTDLVTSDTDCLCLLDPVSSVLQMVSRSLKARTHRLIDKHIGGGWDGGGGGGGGIEEDLEGERGGRRKEEGSSLERRSQPALAGPRRSKDTYVVPGA